MKKVKFLSLFRHCLQIVVLLAILSFNFGVNGVHPARAANPPPANDLFSSRTPINSLPYDPGALDTTGASREFNEPRPGDFPGGCEGPLLRTGRSTVWYEYTPAGTIPVYLDTSGSTTSVWDNLNNKFYEYDTYIAVFVRANTSLPVAIDNLNMVACTDNPNNDTNQARLAFTAEAGTTYYITVAQYDGVLGDLNVYPGYDGGSLIFKMSVGLTISGNAGISGALISYKGGAANADQFGNYSLAIPSGFTNTVTPSLPGVVFSPPSKSYTNITSNQTGQDYTARRTFPTISRWTQNFDLSHGWTVSQYVRTVGDVNGDGKIDLVGFGLDGVYVTTSTGSGFNSISKWSSSFDLSHGWTVSQYVRTVGDVNGDGRDDLVGFGLDGVYVALSNGSGFNAISKWSSSFDLSHGWTVSQYVRTVGDVNGDGRDDLVGFGLDGVYVALAQNSGSGFDAISKWSNDFNLAKGWTVTDFVRTVGDVNGDGRADLVGFGLDGVYVALSNGSGFNAISKWSNDFNLAKGWTVSQYVRTVGDLNGDGRADLVGFGLDGVYVALALNSGSGFGAISKWTSSFDLSHGWTVSQYVRTVGDVSGDGLDDLVGFGLDGVYIAK